MAGRLGSWSPGWVSPGCWSEGSWSPGWVPVDGDWLGAAPGVAGADALGDVEGEATSAVVVGEGLEDAEPDQRRGHQRDDGERCALAVAGGSGGRVGGGRDVEGGLGGPVAPHSVGAAPERGVPRILRHGGGGRGAGVAGGLGLGAGRRSAVRVEGLGVHAGLSCRVIGLATFRTPAFHALKLSDA